MRPAEFYPDRLTRPDLFLQHFSGAPRAADPSKDVVQLSSSVPCCRGSRRRCSMCGSSLIQYNVQCYDAIMWLYILYCVSPCFPPKDDHTPFLLRSQQTVVLDTGLVSRFIFVCTRCVTSERMILTINGNNKENSLFDLTQFLQFSTETSKRLSGQAAYEIIYVLQGKTYAENKQLVILYILYLLG